MHVAVGVIINTAQQVLIAERPLNKTKPGYWEFPGGKVEPGETVLAALQRELKEEVGISVAHAVPFIKVTYFNGEVDIDLDTWVVKAFAGEPIGCEGQVIKWVSIAELDQYTFPEGNKAIINKLKLMPIK